MPAGLREAVRAPSPGATGSSPGLSSAARKSQSQASVSSSRPRRVRAPHGSFTSLLLGFCLLALTPGRPGAFPAPQAGLPFASGFAFLLPVRPWLPLCLGHSLSPGCPDLATASNPSPTPAPPKPSTLGSRSGLPLCFGQLTPGLHPPCRSAELFLCSRFSHTCAGNCWSSRSDGQG